MILEIHAVDTVSVVSHRHKRRENVRFYRDLLNLPLDYSQCTADVVAFKLHQRELRITLAEHVEVNRNRVRVTFQVNNLESAWTILSQNGYDSNFYRGGSLASQRVYVSDPTGYLIELFELQPF